MADRVVLECTQCKNRNYVTYKNKKHTTERLELNASDVEDVKRYVRHRRSGVGLQANPDTEKYKNGTAYKI